MEVTFSRRKLIFFPNNLSLPPAPCFPPPSFLPGKLNRWSLTSSLKGLLLQDRVSLTRHSARKLSLPQVCPDGTHSKFLFPIFCRPLFLPSRGNLIFQSARSLSPCSSSGNELFCNTGHALLLCSSKEKWTAVASRASLLVLVTYFQAEESEKPKCNTGDHGVPPGELPKPNPSCSFCWFCFPNPVLVYSRWFSAASLLWDSHTAWFIP